MPRSLRDWWFGLVGPLIPAPERWPRPRPGQGRERGGVEADWGAAVGALLPSCPAASRLPRPPPALTHPRARARGGDRIPAVAAPIGVQCLPRSPDPRTHSHAPLDPSLPRSPPPPSFSQTKTTLATMALSAKEQDIQMLLAAQCHLGTKVRVGAREEREARGRSRPRQRGERERSADRSRLFFFCSLSPSPSPPPTSTPLSLRTCTPPWSGTPSSAGRTASTSSTWRRCGRRCSWPRASSSRSRTRR